jgi:hypothetical protein
MGYVMNLINFKKVSALAAMTATLTASFVVSAFMQPVKAQLGGETYDEMSYDQQNILFQLSLVRKPDSQRKNRLLGEFKEAVEVRFGSGEVCVTTDPNAQAPICATGTQQGRYVYDAKGYPILAKPFTVNKTLSNLTLRAEFFKAGQDPIIPNSKSDSIGYSVFEPQKTEPLLMYRLVNLDNINTQRAVNSLQYILKNNLFKNALPVFREDTLQDGPGCRDGGANKPCVGFGDIILHGQNPKSRSISEASDQPD